VAAVVEQRGRWRCVSSLVVCRRAPARALGAARGGRGRRLEDLGVSWRPWEVVRRSSSSWRWLLTVGGAWRQPWEALCGFRRILAVHRSSSSWRRLAEQGGGPWSCPCSANGTGGLEGGTGVVLAPARPTGEEETGAREEDGQTRVWSASSSCETRFELGNPA
jgi:hypothetical protein